MLSRLIALLPLFLVSCSPWWSRPNYAVPDCPRRWPRVESVELSTRAKKEISRREFLAALRVWGLKEGSGGAIVEVDGGPVSYTLFSAESRPLVVMGKGSAFFGYRVLAHEFGHLAAGHTCHIEGGNFLMSRTMRTASNTWPTAEDFRLVGK